jgi:hypothetical protein
MHIKFWQQHCKVHINSEKPYTLAGFEPGIFCSVGGCDDHYTMPPWQKKFFLVSSRSIAWIRPLYHAIPLYHLTTLPGCQDKKKFFWSAQDPSLGSDHYTTLYHYTTWPLWPLYHAAMGKKIFFWSAQDPSLGSDQPRARKLWAEEGAAVGRDLGRFARGIRPVGAGFQKNKVSIFSRIFVRQVYE